jgi:uncharacterized protein YlxW (UPF0749 family)
MSEVNYNETVVIPVLQKKYQDLMNSNLVLEVNLMVEQTKTRDLQAKIDTLQAKLDSMSKKNLKKKEEQLDGQTY